MSITNIKEHIKVLTDTITRIQQEESKLAADRIKLEKELETLKQYLSLPYLERERNWITTILQQLAEDKKEIEAEINKIKS